MLISNVCGQISARPYMRMQALDVWVAKCIGTLHRGQGHVFVYNTCCEGTAMQGLQLDM